MSERLRSAALAAAIALALISSTAATVSLHEGYIAIPPTCCQDHQYYLAMAGGLPEQPTAQNVRPFAYRVLSPALVRLMPVPSRLGFHVLTIASLMGTLILFFYVLKAMGFGNEAAVAGQLLFGSLYWATEWTQMDFALVDPLSFLLFAAVILALYKSAPTLLLVTLISAAVANKEIAFVLVPVALIVLARTSRWSATAALTLTAIPIGTFAAIHALAPAHGDYEVWPVVQDVVESRFSSWADASGELKSYFIPTWGPVLLIILLQPQTLIRFVTRFPELLLLYLLVHAQLLVASDTGRVLVIAYVAVIPAALVCLQRSLPNRRSVLAVAVVLVAMQATYFEFTRVAAAQFAHARETGEPGAMKLETPMILGVFVLAALLAVPVWIQSLRSGRQHPVSAATRLNKYGSQRPN